MIAQTCRDFLDAEVYPKMTELERANRDLMKSILKKSGELGLMGISVPEEYGGFGQSFVTPDARGGNDRSRIFILCCVYGSCGIGTMPIVYYGNKDQRERYVTKLATGELLGAYCLTERAQAATQTPGKQMQVVRDGKHYIINGQKMWITNAGLRIHRSYLPN